MRIIDNIARRLGIKGEPAYVAPVKTVTDREKVWANPSHYTRASRRAAGYLKPVWAELMKATASQRVFTRFVHRHSSTLIGIGSRTHVTRGLVQPRRRRKARARCVAALARRGMVAA